MTFTGSLLLAAAIAVAALLAGRLYVGAFGSDIFRRLDAAAAAASLAIGTAWLTLLSVSLSALGLSAPAMLPLLAALQLVPLALCLWRGRLAVLRPAGSLRGWVSLLLPVAVALVLALLPILRTNGYAVGNDTYTYGAFSEWLQRHGFSESCRGDLQSPVTGIPALWQSQHYDLGIAHWLALVQAATRASSVLLVYPATAAFGMALLTATVWLAARQLLRFGTLAAGLTALLFAAMPHPLYWGHHNGFLQQTYALPLLLLGLVLAARCLRPARWNASTAALFAVSPAFLLAVYLPLVPTFMVAMGVAFGPILLRAVQSWRRLATFAAWVLLVVGILAGRDLVGALAPLGGFVSHVSGGHIPLDALQFSQFAVGTRVVSPGWGSVEVEPWTALNRAVAPVYAGLALVGLWQAWRRPRRRALAAAASVLLLGVAYYGLAVKDPWRGHLGHTWNVFKLMQWQFAFVVLLGALGLRRLTAGLSRGRWLLLGGAWLLPFSLVGNHWTWARELGETMQEVLPGPAPLRDLPALKERIRHLPPGTLLLVGKPSNSGRWLGAITALLAYPRAIVGDWTDSASLGMAPGAEALYESVLKRMDGPGVIPLLAGFVPFQEEGVEPLGGGFARLLPDDTPAIVQVMNPAGLDRGAGRARPAFPIGQGRTKIVCLSRTERPLELQVSLRPYPGRPGSRLLVSLVEGDYDRRRVRLATERPPDVALDLAGETDLHIPLPAARGLRTVVLVVDDPRGGASRPTWTVVGLRLAHVPVASVQPRS